MKKLISLLLAMLMLAGTALAEPLAEENATLTYEEVEMYLTALGKTALESGVSDTAQSEDGTTSVSFSGGALLIADETLQENTAILGAVLGYGQPCPRGLIVGDSLQQLLAVYPNDNANLQGTYFDAALYIAGEKPEATAGWLLRDGQRITEITHCVFHWTADGVTTAGVTYFLEQDMITEINVFCMGELVEEAQALELMNEVAEMQEINEYFAFPKSEDGSQLDPFDREDLTFAGMDFLDLTVEMATEALGSAPVDEWSQDSTGEYLRLKQWDGVSLLFVYDANKQFLRVDSMTVNDDVLEGPRGVRIGDMMEQVMYRFTHGQGATVENGYTLYGDGQTAPYGILSYGEETATITYTLALEDGKTVIWHLTFVNGELQSMNMLLR